MEVQRESELKLSVPDAGEIIGGRYEILEPIGAGGMGAVFKARQISTDKLVALKVLSATFGDNDINLQRFQREAKTAAALSHQNLVTVIDYGSEDGRAFLVLELVPGITLSQWLKENGCLTVTQFQSLFRQVCRGLAHVHAAGIVHRDLKPSNIMIVQSRDSEEMLVKIVDFGIAKVVASETQALTATGDTVGSPLYMSPEHGLGHVVDARSDIYSLGCVMFESLVGEPPFIGETPIQTMCMHMQAAVPSIRSLRPEVPVSIESIVSVCMEKAPGDRFSSVSALAQALQSGETVQRPQKGRPFDKAIVIGVGLTLLACGTVYSFTQMKSTLFNPAPVNSTATISTPVQVDYSAGISDPRELLRLAAQMQGEGKLEASRPLLNKVRSIYVASNYIGGQAEAMSWLANSYEIEKDFDAAIKIRREYADLLATDKTGDQWLKSLRADALYCCGTDAINANRRNDAVKFLKETLPLLRELNSPRLKDAEKLLAQHQ
jgi:serine/threonine protein kinase